MIRNALKNGINKGISNWRVILILWFINFLFSLPFFFSTNSLLSKAFSKSLIFEKTLNGDISLFLEFMTHYKREIGILLLFSILLSFLYWLINLFLSGGIIFILKEDSKNLRDIFASAPMYFWRFIKLSLLFIPLFIIFFIIWRLRGKSNELFSNLTGSEKFSFYFSLLTFIIVCLIFLVLRILFDYGRIRIVFEEERTVTLSLLRTINLVFKNFGKTFILYILLNLFLLIYYIPFLFLMRIPSNSFLLILIFFVFSQALLFLRSFFSFLFYSAQIELYKKLATP